MHDAEPEHRRTVWWPAVRARPTFARLDGDGRVDVAIVGGGIAGMCAALHLARRGAGVAVLEAGEIGQGASGVNAGFVVPNFAKADPAAVVRKLGTEVGERLLRLVGAGADEVFTLARDNAIACDAEQTGWIHVAHKPAMMQVLADRAAAWTALGRPIRMLSAAEARAATGMRLCHGGLVDPSAGMLNPLAYLYGLAVAARAAGARIYERSAVTGVARTATGWELTSAGGKVSAGHVLLLTNAASTGIARTLHRAIVPLRVYQIATAPLPADVVRRISPGRNPVADTRANIFTYRFDRDDRLISGGMAMWPAGAHGRMARTIARRLQHELALPQVPEVDFIWSGTAAVTPDLIPHVYELGPGFLGGIGCNGRGIAVTTVLGRVLADAVLGAPLATLAIPLAKARPIPFHVLAKAAPSVAIAQARFADYRDGV